MLKSIVNGAEHDIVSIPMKGRNLWNPDSRTNNQVGQLNWGVVLPAGVYTIVNNSNTSVYQRDGVDSTQATTFAAAGTTKTVRFNNALVAWTSSKQTQIMLNIGTEPLPYEPYGYQEGWEIRDNQDRILWGREDELQTATGTLPFKGYSLPVKVKSLLGNGQQTGTPSPDNIIIPTFCGVRTGNLFDVANLSDVGWATRYPDLLEAINSLPNGTYTMSMSFELTSRNDTTDSSACGWYIAKGTNALSNIRLSWRNAQIGEIMTGIGTFTINDNNRGAFTALYLYGCGINGVGRTGYATAENIMLNLGTTALPYEPYGWKVPFENHGENLWSEEYPNISGTIQYIPLYVGEGSFTLSTTTPYDRSVANVFLLSGNVSSGASTSGNGAWLNHNVTAQSDSGYITVAYRHYTGTTSPADCKTMLNPGSTPKPYSPYLNETIPVYLGEVPTVRRIRKYEFTGTEALQTSGSGNARFFYMTIADARSWAAIISDRYVNANVQSTTEEIGVAMSGNSQFRIRPDTTSTVEEYKQYLASEYAAGHPVTVWYVLNEPETAISNEPLCKISTYADELTTIQVHGLSAPLYGIGDYKDTLNLSTGVVTRKIKKYEFTGNEEWNKGNYPQSGSYQFFTPKPSGIIANPSSWIITHFKTGATLNGSAFGSYLSLYPEISILPENASANHFKNWLAAQYANGTPVTIWYILETPETETVTVPTSMTGEIEGYLTQISTPTPTRQSIPKWNGKEETDGTYAVTVYTQPEIQTTTGQNTLTVETEKIHGVTSPLCGIGDYKDVLNLSTGIITRKIKKLVLTGEEIFGKYTQRDDDWLYYYTLGSANNASVTTAVCTHAIYQSYTSQGSSPYARISDTKASLLINLGTVIGNNSIESFKSYIAAQYANGTPVTVWYVLNTSETETIAVPYGLECTVEGYLTQSGTPTPSNPITPESNGILESNGTYAVEVSLVPSNLTVKGHIKQVQ